MCRGRCCLEVVEHTGSEIHLAELAGGPAVVIGETRRVVMVLVARKEELKVWGRKDEGGRPESSCHLLCVAVPIYTSQIAEEMILLLVLAVECFRQ